MAIPGFIDGPVAVQLAHVSVIYALVIVYAMVGLRFPVAVAACWGAGYWAGGCRSASVRASIGR